MLVDKFLWAFGGQMKVVYPFGDLVTGARSAPKKIFGHFGRCGQGHVKNGSPPPRPRPLLFGDLGRFWQRYSRAVGGREREGG